MYGPALLNQRSVLHTLKLWDVAFFKVKTLVLRVYEVYQEEDLNNNKKYNIYLINFEYRCCCVIKFYSVINGISLLYKSTFVCIQFCVCIYVQVFYAKAPSAK